MHTMPTDPRNDRNFTYKYTSSYDKNKQEIYKSYMGYVVYKDYPGDTHLSLEMKVRLGWVAQLVFESDAIKFCELGNSDTVFWTGD